MKLRLQMLFGVLLAGLLAAPLFLTRGAKSPRSPETSSGAVARYGFRLQEVAQSSGVDFRHQAPTLDPRLNNIMPLIASMGAGVAVADFDRDGWQDFYVTNSGEGTNNALYRNLGNGKFEDVAAALGVAAVNERSSGVSMGAVWGDFDNDGYEDLFVFKWGRPELFRNDAGKRFVRVTEQTGFPSWVNANTAIWLDYDRDGLLDLFLGGYYDENLNLWKLSTTRIMPESFEYARNGGRKYLLRNLGDGRFEDVTARTGLLTRRWALAVAAADLRGTGYPDLVIANDYGVAEFFANVSDGHGGRMFREIGAKTKIGAQPKSGMNVAFGDIRNDGRLAIYVSNITEPAVLVQGNNLWVPKAGSGAEDLTYENVANVMGVENGGWSFGAQFGDLNNDGLVDLFLTNGNVSGAREKSYWYPYSEIAGANTAIISDSKNWPAMQEASLSGYQQKRVWLNRGGEEFLEVAPLVGVTETYDGRAVAQADLWNRGALDVLVANQKAPLLLYRNEAKPDHRWIQFELEGTRSNRSAIGASVVLFWDGKQQRQEVLGGCGFCAQNQRRLHFGLGTASQVDKVLIRWPSGHLQTVTAPAVGQLHRIKEPA